MSSIDHKFDVKELSIVEPRLSAFNSNNERNAAVTTLLNTADDNEEGKPPILSSTADC